MVDIQTVNLIDLVPTSIRQDANVQAAAEALGQELLAVSNELRETLLLSRIDELPEEVVDLLAWQWHVDFYEGKLALAKKRELVKSSIAWHRQKGTPAVVQDMVSTVLGSGKVLEWFEYGGQPYWFKVECTDTIQDGHTLTRLWELINAVKNVRSWCEAIQVRQDISGHLYLGGAIHRGEHITIRPVSTSIDGGELQLYIGHARHEADFITINPEVA